MTLIFTKYFVHVTCRTCGSGPLWRCCDMLCTSARQHNSVAKVKPKSSSFTTWLYSIYVPQWTRTAYRPTAFPSPCRSLSCSESMLKWWQKTATLHESECGRLHETGATLFTATYALLYINRTEYWQQYKHYTIYSAMHRQMPTRAHCLRQQVCICNKSVYSFWASYVCCITWHCPHSLLQTAARHVAAWCCCGAGQQQSIDSSYPPGPRQQTLRTLFQWANGTDRWTDTVLFTGCAVAPALC